MVVQQHLENSNLFPENVGECMVLLKEVLEQNYFEFNGKFYDQQDRLAMDSPLFGILSDLYLYQIENELIFSDKNKLMDKIVYHHRYVDETMKLFNDNGGQLNKRWGIFEHVIP